MKTIEVKQNQTLADVAIQEYGCYEGVFTLMEDNNWLSVDYDMATGQPLNIRDAVPVLNENNVQIANLFKTQKISPNSGYMPELVEGEFVSEEFESLDFIV